MARKQWGIWDSAGNNWVSFNTGSFYEDFQGHLSGDELVYVDKGRAIEEMNKLNKVFPKIKYEVKMYNGS